MKNKRRYRLLVIPKRKLKRYIRSIKRYSKRKCKECSNKNRTKRLKCPSLFSVLDYPDKSTSFFKELKSVASLNPSKIKIDLSQVQIIDHLTIMMLLSNINHIVQQGIKIQGNTPKDSKAKYIFEHSGFFNHVKCINKRKSLISYRDELIIDMGKDIFNSVNADKLISAILMKMGLSNKKNLHQCLNGFVGEMGGNTIQYAYNSNKHYLFGAFPNSNYTSFIFADTGFGILGTLKKNFKQMIGDLIKLKGPEDVLYGAFVKKYGSNTGEENRNRGLPYILDTFNKGLVQNLLVISNNVFLNFANRNKSTLLKENYDGTVYYWEIKGQMEDNTNNI